MMNNPIKFFDRYGDEVENAHKEKRNKLKDEKKAAKKKLDNYEKKHDLTNAGYFKKVWERVTSKEYNNLKSNYNDKLKSFQDVNKKYKAVKAHLDQIKKHKKDFYDKIDNLKNKSGEEVNVFISATGSYIDIDDSNEKSLDDDDDAVGLATPWDKGGKVPEPKSDDVVRIELKVMITTGSDLRKRQVRTMIHEMQHAIHQSKGHFDIMSEWHAVIRKRSKDMTEEIVEKSLDNFDMF